MKAYRYESSLSPTSRDESAAWAAIEHSFRSTKRVAPRRGFGARWLLAQRQQDLSERKRRDLWLAIGNGTAILVILALVSVSTWPLFSQPANLVAAVLESFFDRLALLFVWFGVALAVFKNFSLLAWFGVAMAFFSLIALWTSLFSRVMVENTSRT